jgi:MFS family permease
MRAQTARALPIPALRDIAPPARRNVLLLAAGMAALYGMVELAAAVAALTFTSAGGSRGLAGLAPAVFLATAALTALPAGSAMDRFGRAPILRVGFGFGICGSLVAALGAFAESIVPVVLGFVLIGASIGTVMLSRAAAADMYPPERRAQGIGLVLFGAVFGALLGPVVFIPLVSSGNLEGSTLGPAWLGAAGFMVVGLALMGAVRHDPQQIAGTLALEGAAAEAPAEPIGSIVRRPGIPVALVAAVASWTVMVALMTLSGKALVDHGHSRDSVFPVLSAHFVGMFALFPLVGRVIDRAGRERALVGGLVLLAVSALALAGSLHSVPLSGVVLLGVGLGWSFSYVAATAELAEGARPAERGRLLGFADLISGLCGAALTVLAGLALARIGIEAICVAGAAVAGLAALWIVLRARANA